MEINRFKQVTPFRWLLEKEDKLAGMNTDAEIFGTEAILQAAVEDESIKQVINVASLPGIVSRSLAMPDIHYGYGFCIGGVAAFPADSGIVSPGGVGYDINCGVRLITTRIPFDHLEKYREAIGYKILSNIPTGLNDKGKLALNQKQFMRLLQNGAEEVVSQYSKISGDRDYLPFIESEGKLDFHMTEALSERAIDRGKNQAGSLGGGNHFIEVQRVEEIYDPQAAGIFGLEKGMITIMVHTGSRGFGHQVATDFIERIRKRYYDKIKSRIKDPQLIYAEINSKEGQQYLQAMNAAANFAWANRHLIMEEIMVIFEEIFAGSVTSLGMRLLYDQAHNIAKFEDHTLNGKKQHVLVHRKGATRSFPPGHPDIPPLYRGVGQPVLLPGSMGTASYVLKGTHKAMEISLGSSAHGAGRRLSRHKAIQFSANMNVREHLKTKNVMAFSHSQKGLKEEIPEAYKEINDIAAITEGAGISDKVARLVPLIVIKG